MNEELVCPLCDRDYELPRRYLTRPDDIEFLAVPRLLGCLHTCCQSCLEEMWQKQSKNSIDCPQCRNIQHIKSVWHLPLDGAALSHMIPLNASSSSWCSRCHDEVPSFSWCRTCSAAFCQFHHQDHRLSVNTSQHDVLTFKDIAQNGIVIEPSMPAISCPDELEEDATLFCHDCNYAASAKAILSKHRTHRSSDIRDLLEGARETVEQNIELCREREEGLVNAMKAVRNTMYQLNHEREMCENDLRAIFGELKQQIQNREDALMQRLHDISQRKKLILTTQLDDMSVALDSTRHCIQVAERLLLCTEGVQGGDPYVLTASNTISARCDEIDETIIQIPFEPQTDPTVRVSFVEHELELIRTVAKAAGAVLTRDNTPASRELQDLHPDCNGYEKGERDVKNSSNIEAEHNDSAPLGPLAFTVHTSPAPKLSMDNRMAYSKECVVVEIRAKPNCSEALYDVDDSTNSITDEAIAKHDDSCDYGDPDLCRRPAPIALGKSKYSTQESLGRVLGQVVLLTEVDKRLVRKHKIRTNFESFLSDDRLPTFRLTREIVGD